MRLGHWRMAAALLAASTLGGCAAALIPVLASGALASKANGPEDDAAPEPAPPARVEVSLPGTSDPPPASAMLSPSSQPAPVTPAARPAQLRPELRPALPGVPAITAPLATLQLTSFDPAFARLADYALAAARAATPEAPPRSALLADPVALDGTRRACLAGQTPAVVIDLDAGASAFAAPASLPALPEHAAALAAMRAAGITIAWISQGPITQTGALRSALEGAGLDPRGQDVLMIPRDGSTRKQMLREALAGNACILAIGGDERTDFDERFGYLRDPAAGARLETLIGEGPWFLIRNIFSSTPSTGTPAP